MIAVCIRIHEAHRWAIARACYEQQTHKDRCLVVIANGCDVDVKGIKGKPLVRRYAEPLGYGGSAQACLVAAREIGAEQACIWDAGDEYRPGQVAAIVAALGPHDDRERWDGCGQGGFLFQSVRGILKQRLSRCNQPAQWGMIGGTLGFWTDTALDFDPGIGRGEDRDWVLRMIKGERSMWSCSADHYLKIPTSPEATK
jgi:hypothetical protein